MSGSGQKLRDCRRIVNPALNGRQMHAIEARTLYYGQTPDGNWTDHMALWLFIYLLNIHRLPWINGCAPRRLYTVKLVLQHAD